MLAMTLNPGGHKIYYATLTKQGERAFDGAVSLLYQIRKKEKKNETEKLLTTLCYKAVWSQHLVNSAFDNYIMRV